MPGSAWPSTRQRRRRRRTGLCLVCLHSLTEALRLPWPIGLCMSFCVTCRGVDAHDNDDGDDSVDPAMCYLREDTSAVGCRPLLCFRLRRPRAHESRGSRTLHEELAKFFEKQLGIRGSRWVHITGGTAMAEQDKQVQLLRSEEPCCRLA